MGDSACLRFLFSEEDTVLSAGNQQNLLTVLQRGHQTYTTYQGCRGFNFFRG